MTLSAQGTTSWLIGRLGPQQQLRAGIGGHDRGDARPPAPRPLTGRLFPCGPNGSAPPIPNLRSSPWVEATKGLTSVPRSRELQAASIRSLKTTKPSAFSALSTLHPS